MQLDLSIAGVLPVCIADIDYKKKITGVSECVWKVNINTSNRVLEMCL